MRDRGAAARRIGGEFGVGKMVDHRLIESWHLALGQRDAIQQSHDALGDRAQIMLHVGVERDGSQQAPPRSSTPVR